MYVPPVPEGEEGNAPPVVVELPVIRLTSWRELAMGSVNVLANMAAVPVHPIIRTGLIISALVGYVTGKKGEECQRYSEVVSSVEELKDMEGSNKNFVLVKDIDCSGETTNCHLEGDFKGGFNGRHHKITGLKKCLFNSISDQADVRNLAIENANIKSNGTKVGVLACDVMKSTVENIIVRDSRITATGGGSSVGVVVGGSYDAIYNNVTALNNTITDILESSVTTTASSTSTTADPTTTPVATTTTAAPTTTPVATNTTTASSTSKTAGPTTTPAATTTTEAPTTAPVATTTTTTTQNNTGNATTSITATTTTPVPTTAMNLKPNNLGGVIGVSASDKGMVFSISNNITGRVNDTINAVIGTGSNEPALSCISFDNQPQNISAGACNLISCNATSLEGAINCTLTTPAPPITTPITTTSVTTTTQALEPKNTTTAALSFNASTDANNINSTNATAPDTPTKAATINFAPVSVGTSMAMAAVGLAVLAGYGLYRYLRNESEQNPVAGIPEEEIMLRDINAERTGSTESGLSEASTNETDVSESSASEAGADNQAAANEPSASQVNANRRMVYGDDGVWV